MLLLQILLAHFLGDFFLQPKSWVASKENRKLRAPQLYYHILVHGALLFLFLWDTGFWLLALLLMLVHGIIDVVKLYSQDQRTKNTWFLIDQGLHLLSILILWGIWAKPEIDWYHLIMTPQLWLFALAIAVLTSASGIFIQVLLSGWSSAINDGRDESLSNAGKYIGILERLFVFTFIVLGKWEAIGFLLAAKSIFRFGDLKESKDRKLTEYILIGTLLSFAIATAMGLLVLWLGPFL